MPSKLKVFGLANCNFWWQDCRGMILKVNSALHTWFWFHFVYLFAPVSALDLGMCPRVSAWLRALNIAISISPRRNVEQRAFLDDISHREAPSGPGMMTVSVASCHHNEETGDKNKWQQCICIMWPDAATRAPSPLTHIPPIIGPGPPVGRAWWAYSHLTSRWSPFYGERETRGKNRPRLRDGKWRNTNGEGFISFLWQSGLWITCDHNSPPDDRNRRH